MSSFTRKIIRTTIILDPKAENFAGKDANTLVVQGLRTTVQCSFGNGEAMPTANVKIWGLDLNSMNKLTSVKWKIMGVQNNIVKIEVGDDEDNLDLLYTGNISFAYPDFSGAPDVALCIESHMALFHQLNPVVPTSYKGGVDVSKIMESLATAMKMKFENNGVTAQLNDPYLPNTALDQARTVAKMADIDLYLDVDTLAICPKGVHRKLTVPVISPSSGLIGYPIPDKTGVQFKCLYDKLVRFGAIVEIQDSVVEQCNCQWRAIGLTINLDAELPSGQWFCDVKATELGEAGNAPIVVK